MSHTYLTAISKGKFKTEKLYLSLFLKKSKYYNLRK